MEKTRVDELAKELGIESEALLMDLRENGFVLRSASSTIPTSNARIIRYVLNG